MWKLELMEALMKFWDVVDWTTVLVKDVGAAADGIVIHTTNNESWKYFYETREIKKLKPWRERY